MASSSSAPSSGAFSIRETAKDITSAVFGSICCCYTGQPFDTVKTRVQANPSQYSSSLNALSVTVREEGLKALWKGSVPTAAGMIAENAVAFGVSEQIKRVADFYSNADHGDQTKGKSTNYSRTFLIGGFTGFFSSLVLIPSVRLLISLCLVSIKSTISSNGESYRKLLKPEHK